MAESRQVRGRDVDAPVQHVTIDGQSYEMRFDNRAARVAEDVYEQQYGMDKGYYDILAEMARKKHRAIEAVVYGAMVSGGHDMDWAEFDAKFTLGSLDAVREAIQTALIESLPDDDGNAKNG